jgi:Methylase involved in ubiquinone/menaquinone biosynthesis
MKFTDLQKNWDALGKTDPLWAVYSDPQKKGNRWDAAEFFETGSKEIDFIMKHLKSLGVEIAHDKALDFGCGVGRLTRSLAAYFNNVVGVDIAPSMIELAKKYASNSPSCDFYLNQNDDLALFGDSTFDLIYTNVVLQHMEPVYSRRYLAEFIRILKPGGLLVFQLPSELVEPASLRHWISSSAPNVLRRAYSKIRRVITNSPQIEMYGIRKEKVIEFFKGQNARIVDISRDFSASAYWISYRYCIMKNKMVTG